MRNFLRWAALFVLPVVALLFVGTPSEAQAIAEMPDFFIAGATLGVTALNLLDWAKRQDPSGKTARIVEMLSQRNDMITDALWVPGNLPTGHRTTVRTGLPSVFWRLLNRGVAPSKSTTAQIDVQAGMLEARSQVDKDLALLNDDLSAFRLSEAQPFLEAMSQEAASTMIYGAATAPEEFIGLAPQYASLSAANAQNIVNGAGSGSDNASIWLIVWGDQTVHGTFPKGSTAGLIHEDLGLDDVKDADGNEFRAYKDWWQWKLGIVVRDWRYAVRICNIDISNLVAESSNADLLKLMTKAWHRIKSFNMGRASFYMNRTCFQMLDIQAQAAVKSGGQLSYSVVDGKPVLSFRTIPIRICDALVETEATVS